MPKNVTEAIALVIFAAICVIVICIIVITSHDVPAIVGDLALVAIGGGAGVARQNYTNRRP